MKLVIALVVVTAAGSVDAGKLSVTAEHAGGDSLAIPWAIRIVNGHVSVSTSDAARNRGFEVTEEQRRQFVALLENARFFPMKSHYGTGTIEANTCRMKISWGDRKNSVNLRMYSSRMRPSETEASEVQRAYRVWDAIKAIGGLSDLSDDCRIVADMGEFKR